MTARNHLYLLYLSTTFWTWFFLGGLWTNYYQNLSFINALVFVIIFPTIIMIWIGKRLLLSITKNNYFKAAFVCSSYFAFVLLIYDFIYLKLYLGKSFYYLIDYWYLTFFAPIPYLVFLLIGHRLDKKRSEEKQS